MLCSFLMVCAFLLSCNVQEKGRLKIKSKRKSTERHLRKVKHGRCGAEKNMLDWYSWLWQSRCSFLWLLCQLFLVRLIFSTMSAESWTKLRCCDFKGTRKSFTKTGQTTNSCRTVSLRTSKIVPIQFKTNFLLAR